MNCSHSHMAHPRLDCAHWPEPLTAPGAARACPTCLPSPANQLTFQDDTRPVRPLNQGVRFASVPASIGGCIRVRPAGFSPRTPAMDALIGGRRAGSPGLRSLAPLPSAAASNQHSLTDLPGFTRPFLPSSLVPGARLRAERIGGVILFDPSCGVLGNRFRDSLEDPARPTGLPYLRGHFPRSNDRRDSTFPRESSGRAAAALFPPFFRVSGTLQKPLACGSFSHRIRSKQPTT